ncbi:MAG: xylulose kinase, partial [Anaerolineaceae bacterium]|nr:xylulose kinase [Anaerolineaceae bacterium]
AQYLFDPAFRTMYGGIPGSFILETVLLGGTYTISWFLEKFGGVDPLTLPVGMSAEDVLESEASLVPPGTDGLTLVPYWNSAMNPCWDAAASGIIVGWRGFHGRAHLYRAILEGIAFELRLHSQGVERALNIPIVKYIAVGGGARSKLWCQIIADICGRPVFVAESPEATSLGAGILAAAAAGLYADPGTAARAMTRISTSSFQPDPTRAEFYKKLYEEVYRNLYPALQPYLDRLADLSERDKDH